MAELHAATRGGERPPAHRPLALPGADRGPLRRRRFPLGAPIRRRPAAQRLALLHQLGGAPVHSGRAAQGRRVREVSGAVRAVWSRRFDTPAVTTPLFHPRSRMSPVTQDIKRRDFLELGAAAGDAAVAARLRAAGAVLLGKANLSEWANFRSNSSSSGWSARGGQCKNPYALDRSPCGSSSGTAAAIAANFAAVGIGTETDGSIVCPSAACSLVGIKPTLGLVSRTGIVPIAHSQDTAGPMTRTVRDAAILLGALVGPDPKDAATAAAPAPLPDYTRFLDPQGLTGARLRVPRTKLSGYHPATAP